MHLNVTKGFSSVVRVDLSALADEVKVRVILPKLLSIVEKFNPSAVEYLKTTSEFLVMCDSLEEADILVEKISSTEF